jgi:hypothetical protein
MGLSKKTAELLLDTGQGRVPKFYRPDCEPAGFYYLPEPDGSLALTFAQPAHQTARALSLASLADAVADCNAQAVAPAVWYSAGGVVAVLDAKTQLRRVTLELSPSPQAQSLRELEKNRTALSQRDIVLKLRTTFADSMGPCPNLLPTLRNVRFGGTTDGESVIEHGKASLGKKLAAQIEGTGSLPEYVTLDVPLFAQPLGYRGPVRCALEPNPTEQTFQLLPLPRQIELATLAAEESLGQDLRDLLGKALAGVIVPVYYGRP